MRKNLLGSTAIGTMAALLAVAATPAVAGTAHTTAGVKYVAHNSGGLDWSGFVLSGIGTFDTTQGNLQSVLVVENLSATIGGQVTETSSTTSGTVTGHTKVTISSGPSTLVGEATLNPMNVSATQAYNNSTTGNLAFQKPQSFTPGAVGTGSMTATLGAGADWESVGPGTTSVTLDSATTASANLICVGNSQPGCWSFAPTVTETYSLTVAYNYTTGGANTADSVPEPASALLLGSGVLALGKLRARKQRKKV